MKKESLITAMKNSISNVLETMFFLPLVFSDDVHKKDCWSGKTDQIMAARLDFDGPFSGYCVFYIPKKFAVSMTANFMGRAEELGCMEPILGRFMTMRMINILLLLVFFQD